MRPQTRHKIGDESVVAKRAGLKKGSPVLEGWPWVLINPKEPVLLFERFLRHIIPIVLIRMIILLNLPIFISFKLYSLLKSIF